MSLHDAHQTEMYYGDQKGLKEGNLNIMTTALTHDEILEARTSLNKNIQVSLSKDQWRRVWSELYFRNTGSGFNSEIMDEIKQQTGL